MPQNHEYYNCPLCQSTKDHQEILTSLGRAAYICQECDLIFISPREHLAPEAEYVRYLGHNNSIDNPGYREFLNKLVAPVLNLLPANAKLLDYGCGPTTAIASMLDQMPYEVVSYDPFFVKNAALQQDWDGILCSEVWEHFRSPADEITKIVQLMHKKSILGVMTSLHSGPAAFSSWWYANDPTHVCFYSAKSFQWIAKHFQLKILLQQGSVVILQKDDE